MCSSDLYIILSTRGCSPRRPDAVMSTDGRETVIPSDFQGSSGAHRTYQDVICFAKHLALSPVNLIPGREFVKKKRQLFPGLLPTSPTSFMLPFRVHGPVGEY